jgi:hypothetical protein
MSERNISVFGSSWTVPSFPATGLLLYLSSVRFHSEISTGAIHMLIFS